VILTGIYFMFMIPHYYLQTWAPILLTDLGLTPARAAFVATFFSVGGVSAGLIITAIATRVPVRLLTQALMACGAGMLIVFSQLPADLTILIGGALVTGICLQGAMVAFSIIMPRRFAAPVRASGTGFVIGFGRLGSTLPPLIAGLLFALDFSRLTVTVLMALPIVLCIALFGALKPRAAGAS
jgi:MFS family permease